MDDYYEFEDYEDSDEGSAEYEDFAEAKKRPRPPSAAKFRSIKNPYAPPPKNPNVPVSDGQMRVTMARLTQQLDAAIARLTKSDADIIREQAAMRKSHDAQRRSVDKLRADLRTTQMLSALLPFLTQSGGTLATLAPLAHLFSDNLSGLAGAPGTAAGGLGNTNNIAMLAGVAYASGAFK